MKRKGFGIFIILMFLSINIYLNMVAIEDYRTEIIELNKKFEQFNWNQYQSTKQIEALEKQINEFLQKWNVGIMEVTAYAPLSPNAVEGMDYSGNPLVTASGARTKPGVTVAASRNIPFGTNMWVDGFGWRVVEDRGGMIGEGKIDVAMWSRREALKWGRREVVVVYPAVR